jgi:hypothetical protein
MNLEKLLVAALAAVAVGAAGVARAAQPDIRLRSGGVGEAEQQAMRDAARDYSLGMSFTNRRGEYVAGVVVSIRDAAGQELVSTTSDGPLMLVDLPPGRYQVQASYAGQPRQQTVVVPPKGRRQLAFSWPSAD